MQASEDRPKNKAKKYLPQTAEDLFQKASTLELAAKRLYYAAEVLKEHGGTVSAFIKRIEEDIPRIVRFSSQCRMAAEEIESCEKVKRVSQAKLSRTRKRRKLG
jgi:hypothetical protein